MDYKTEEYILRSLISNSADLLEPKDIVVYSHNSKPSICLKFNSAAKELKGEEINIYLEIFEQPFLGGTLLPYLRFANYFPFELKHDLLHYKFLIERLSLFKNDFPFIESSIIKAKDDKWILGFHCSKLLIPNTDIDPPEILFYVTLLQANYEDIMSKFKSLPWVDDRK